MQKPNIIIALDIGSNFIRILAVAKKPDEEEFEILSQGQEISSEIGRAHV